MRVTCDINGYYEWVPVPPGTEVSEKDIKERLVKPMADGKWAMRVAIKKGDIEPKDRHTEYHPNELMITQQLAVHALIGKDMSREEWVAMHLKAILSEHLHRNHIVKMTVHDDGPNHDLFIAALADVGVVDPEKVEMALSLYDTGVDMEEYLNTVFSTQYAREKRKAAKKEGK